MKVCFMCDGEGSYYMDGYGQTNCRQCKGTGINDLEQQLGLIDNSESGFLTPETIERIKQVFDEFGAKLPDDKGDYHISNASFIGMNNKLTGESTAIEARIDELSNFHLPVYDHAKCPDPKTCIGYQNAESDFDNEKEIRISQLKDELEADTTVTDLVATDHAGSTDVSNPPKSALKKPQDTPAGTKGEL